MPGMDVLDAIRQRRTLKPKDLKPDPVPREVLEALLEAANWAPSNRGTEPWRFIIYQGEARAPIAQTLVSVAGPEGAPLPEDHPMRGRIQGAAKRAPVGIAVVVQYKTNPQVMDIDEVEATAMAVQNLKLAARAQGLSVFWMSGPKVHHPKVAELLELQPNQGCLGFLWIGYPAVPFPEGKRRPIADKLRWVGSPD